MNPDTGSGVRPAVVLALAAALCVPSAAGLLAGTVSSTALLTRFLIALLGCWCAVAVITALWRSYAGGPAGPGPEEAVPAEQDPVGSRGE